MSTAREPELMMVRLAKRLMPVGIKKWIKVLRAKSFERFGSDRYSFPALNALDRKMLQYLPVQGTFLEVGANDGYSQSNTYYLERWRGWHGILIEPVPWLFKRCQLIRPRSKCFNVACVADVGEQATVNMFDLDLRSVAGGQQPATDERNRLGSRKARRHQVAATTISTVIDEAGAPRIDFMSIDVEGSELQLLRGLDLDRHAPEWLLIETGRISEVVPLLSAHFRLEGQLTHHDYLFHRERAG